MNIRRFSWFFLFGVLGCLPGYLEAALVTLSVNQPQSSLVLSGTVDVADTAIMGAPLEAQGTGGAGLTTSYTGSIVVDVDNLLNPSSITIVSAMLDAATSGVWAPAVGGTTAAPAADGDYGIAVAAIAGVGAARNVVFDLAASAASVSGGDFSVAGQSLTYASGSLDVFSAALNDGGSGVLNQSGNNVSTNSGNYTVVGNTATLTIPLDVTIAFVVPGNPLVSGFTTFTGQVAATATVPEPGGLSLLGVAAMAWTLRRRTRPTLT